MTLTLSCLTFGNCHDNIYSVKELQSIHEDYLKWVSKFVNLADIKALSECGLNSRLTVKDVFFPELEVHDNISTTEKNFDFNRVDNKTICTWKLGFVYRHDRYPFLRQIAVCTSNKDFNGLSDFNYKCREHKELMPVLRKYNHVRGKWINALECVTTACFCEDDPKTIE